MICGVGSLGRSACSSPICSREPPRSGQYDGASASTITSGIPGGDGRRWKLPSPFLRPGRGDSGRASLLKMAKLGGSSYAATVRSACQEAQFALTVRARSRPNLPRSTRRSGACSPCNALRWYRQSGIVLHFFVRDGPGINPRVEPRSQGSTLINHEKTLASELVRFRKTISSWYPGKGVTYNTCSIASVPIN